MNRALNATPDEVRLLLRQPTGQLWRPVKPQPKRANKRRHRGALPTLVPPNRWVWIPHNELPWHFYPDHEQAVLRTPGGCPFGVPGDVLYVRETFSTSGLTRYHDTGNPDHHGGPNDPCCAYAATATYKCGKPVPREALATGAHKWKSSARMPRLLSRIDIEVVAVQAKQVHKMDSDDAIAWGIDIRPPECLIQTYPIALSAKRKWDSLYAKRGLGFDKNPWAWVFDYRRIRP